VFLSTLKMEFSRIQRYSVKFSFVFYSARAKLYIQSQLIFINRLQNFTSLGGRFFCYFKFGVVNNNTF